MTANHIDGFTIDNDSRRQDGSMPGVWTAKVFLDAHRSVVRAHSNTETGSNLEPKSMYCESFEDGQRIYRLARARLVKKDSTARSSVRLHNPLCPDQL